jgi:hypothetical protein
MSFYHLTRRGWVIWAIATVLILILLGVTR